MHQILWLPLRFLFWLLADFKVFGLENLRGIQAPAIFIANHHSRFDPFLVGIALPWLAPFHGIHWLTRDDEFLRPIRRHTLRLLGAFPGKIRRSYSEVLMRPHKLLTKGISVGVFPEWCYEGDAVSLERMQYVTPLLAERTRRPVIAVFLFGVEKVTWLRLFGRRLRIHITFGRPYLPAQAEPPDQIQKAVNRLLHQTRFSHLAILHEEEKRFWEEYGAFYAYLERADAYQELLDDFAAFLPKRVSGAWIDLGSGSGKIAELLLKKASPQTSITATDYAAVMLEQIKKRFAAGVTAELADLARPLAFGDSSVNGITANLVLPYVIHHQGVTGNAALLKLLKDVRRVLKPGGLLIWSTPRHNVRFTTAFLRSLPSILRPDQRENFIYGPRILWQALKIQEKGRRGVYHFLTRKELIQAMAEAGFRNAEIKRSMAGQVYIIRAEKAR